MIVYYKFSRLRVNYGLSVVMATYVVFMTGFCMNSEVFSWQYREVRNIINFDVFPT